MLNPADYEAIIFDFGGVLLDLDYQATRQRLNQLAGREVDIFSKRAQDPFVDRFETGHITEEAFRDEVRNILGRVVADQEVDEAWNAMLIGLPARRLDVLRRVAGVTRIFLLSNTNSIHKRAFEALVERSVGWNDFQASFEHCYWSHLLGLRKPHAEVFHRLRDENGLDPKRTLLIDDSPQHVAGAKQAGWQAIHLDVEAGESIDLLFSQEVS